MAAAASQCPAVELPFFAQGCNLAPAPLLPMPPTRSPPSVAAESRRWQALIDEALATGLRRLCPAACKQEPQQVSSLDSKEADIAAADVKCWRMLEAPALSLPQPRTEPSTSSSLPLSSAGKRRSADLLKCCMDAAGFLDHLRAACLIEYSSDQNAFSRWLLPAARESGGALPSSILLLTGGPACKAATKLAVEADAAALQDACRAQVRVLRLCMSIGDFDIAALTRPLSRPSCYAAARVGSRPGAEPVPFGPVAPPTMELRINGLSGPMCTLLADESMTVGEVKRRVAHKLDIPGPQQRVLFGTRPLNDSEKLGTLEANKPQRRAEEPVQHLMDLTLIAQSAERAYWLQVVRSRGEALSSAPPEIAGDAEIVKVAVQESGFALKYASHELKADKVIVLAAVRKHGLALWNASGSLRADRDVALAAVQQDGLALAHVSEELQNDQEIVRTAVRKKGDALKHASRDLQADRVIVLEAVQRDARALQYAAPTLCADREIIYAAVQQDARFALQSATEELRTDTGIALAAVQSNGAALQFLVPTLRADLDVVIAAVTRSGIALEFAAEQLRDTQEVVMTAVHSNGLALEFASARLQADRHIVLAALQQDAGSLKHAADCLRCDRDIALAAVERSSFAISSVAGELRDRELILATVQKNPSALEHATEEMLADFSFLLAVVQQNALALEHVPPAFRADRRFMLDVVRKNGFALKYASEDLRSDAEVVLAAVQQDRRAIEYADRDSLMAQIHKKKAEAQLHKRHVKQVKDAQEKKHRVDEEKATAEKGTVEKQAKQSQAEQHHLQPKADADVLWRVAVELQGAASGFLVFAQRLCGAEADLAMRSLARAESGSFMAAFIPCCHDLCDWAAYINRDFLAQVFPDAAQAFAMLVSFAAWSGSAASTGCACHGVANTTEGEEDERMCYLGAASRALLDVGRALWLKEVLGWRHVEIKAYTHRSTAPDNLIILARQ